jgi:hypothetical protein
MHQVGDPVRVAPDVKRHGGQAGFVVMVNEGAGPLLEPVPDRTPLEARDTLPRHPEYGVVLTVHRPPWRQDMPGQLNYDSDAVRWFTPAELTSRRES